MCENVLEGLEVQAVRLVELTKHPSGCPMAVTVNGLNVNYIMLGESSEH